MVMGTMAGHGMMKGHRVLDPGDKGVTKVKASGLFSFCFITTARTEMVVIPNPQAVQLVQCDFVFLVSSSGVWARATHSSIALTGESR